MPAKINPGTILIQQSAFSLESLQLEREPYASGSGLALDSQELKRRTRKTRRRIFCLVARPQPFWLFLVLVVMVVGASAQTKSTIPTMETIVARMALARGENESRFRRYAVIRDYQLFGKERDKSKSQVIAEVNFVPSDLKKYSIQRTNGTGQGERIVGRMVASEAEIAKDYLSTDFSPANYEFRFICEEEVTGRRCYVPELLPKRKDRNLLRGNICVGANPYLLRRTEGGPAKIPSWWLRDVRMAFFDGDVGAMWLQTAFEATAIVRILGLHTMVSRDVKYRISELNVAEHPSKLLKHSPDGALRHRLTARSSN